MVVVPLLVTTQVDRFTVQRLPSPRPGRDREARRNANMKLISLLMITWLSYTAFCYARSGPGVHGSSDLSLFVSLQALFNRGAAISNYCFNNALPMLDHVQRD